jgi:hypothetical protein
VPSSLSPIFYLFLLPAGVLYQKVQHLLAGDELVEKNSLSFIKHQRQRPKRRNNGILSEQWPTVIHRVVEQKEPLRTVAVAYGVSHETIRRILLQVQKQRGQQKA